MYLHLGEMSVRSSDIIGIFDIEKYLGVQADQGIFG